MIYLDYNATSPLDLRVHSKMKPFFGKDFANPSAIYRFGQRARSAVETARSNVAKLISASPEEIIFTSGGTEANNLALKGVAERLRSKGNHIITCATEHPSILDVCKYLGSLGYQVTYLGVDRYGCVRIEELKSSFRDETILVSIMHANNETGTIQPVETIAKICSERKVFFHSDAVQTVGKLDVDVAKLGVSALSLSGHKFYGPKGVGALYMKAGIDFTPLIHGGHQEKDRRSGTENVAAIVGLGEAARVACLESRQNQALIRPLRDALQQGILAKIKDAQVNGHPQNRLYNTLNISFNHVQADTLVIALDFKGICASAGSACASGSAEASHVLTAMGLPQAHIRSALRLSLGRSTKKADITKTLAVLAAEVKRLRSLSSSWGALT